MDRFPFFRSPRLPILIALLAALLALGSCDDDSPTECVLYDVGAVEGRVLAAGDGVSTVVAARAMEGPNRMDVVCSTVSDSAGAYRMDLPTGLYRLEVDPNSSMIFINDFRDTVRITPRVHRKDLLRGKVTIRVALPDTFPDQKCTLQLAGRGLGADPVRSESSGGLLEFVCPVVHPGSYLMAFYGYGFFPVYLPDAWSRDTADSLKVGTDHPTVFAVDFTETHAFVGGRITGGWQELGAGFHAPTVVVHSLEREMISQDYCHADGSFGCDVLVAQPVRIKTELDDVEQWIGGDSFETARVFDLQPGGRITDVALATCGIRVLLEGPGERIGYRTDVVVFDEDGNEIRPWRKDDNPFSVCNLRSGRYYLHVDGRRFDQPWAPQWYGGTEIRAEAEPIDLAAGELRRITIELVEGGVIAGEVLDADGGRPDEVKCILSSDEIEPYCCEGGVSQTFHDGLFRYQGLPNGRYYLGAEIGGGGTWWYPGVPDFASATPILITDHQALTDLSLVLPAAGKEVRP